MNESKWIPAEKHCHHVRLIIIPSVGITIVFTEKKKEQKNYLHINEYN
jgi:hypothetical protein